MIMPTLGGIYQTRKMVFSRRAQDQEIITTVSSLVGNLNLRLDKITSQMSDLGRSLQNVSAAIVQNSFLERQKETIEQERERRIAEQQLKEGQESLVERKIENATVAPAQKAAIKAQSSLTRLMGFFTLLLTGWLSPKIIESIRGISKISLEKLTDVKNLISKGFASAANVFKNITTGLLSIIGTITRTTSRIGTSIANGLFKAPVEFLRNAIQGALDGVKKIINPNSTAKSASSTSSSAAAAVSAAPAGTFSPGSSILQTMKGLVANPFAQLVFGTGLNMSQGSSVGQSVSGAAAAAGGIGLLSRAPMPLPFKLGIGLLSAPFLNEAGKNLFSKMSSGFGSGFNLPEGTNFFSEQTISAKATVQPVVPSATIKSESIGPAPEASTNVIVTASPPEQKNIPTNMNPIANDIPSISSSNVDNFYIYYSMANYNVVM